jgi:hypothetical protein
MTTPSSPDFRVDLRQFLADVGDNELVFCKSPVNPRGGWTWMSSGQFFIRNSRVPSACSTRSRGTDLARSSMVGPERYGLFTDGDQDAFVYQLQGPGSVGASASSAAVMPSKTGLPLRARLDEHFICHFALPAAGAKADLIAEFAERLRTNVALVPPELIAPYREFLEYSGHGRDVGIVRAEAESPPPPGQDVVPVRRAARVVRSTLRR